MAVVMLLVTVSRALAIPGYLAELGWIPIDEGLKNAMNSLVFPIMLIAMVAVTPIVLVPMMWVRRKLAKMGLLDKAIVVSEHKRSGLIKRLVIFGGFTFANYYLLFRDPDWWPQFVTSIPHSSPLLSVAMSLGVIGLAIYWSFIHGSFAHAFLDLIKVSALRDDLAKRIAQQGYKGMELWAASVTEAETIVPNIEKVSTQKGFVGGS
jgi:hypothetical protein